MKTLLTTVALLTVFSVIAGPLSAHHGRGSTYDMNMRVTLKGVVSRVAGATRTCHLHGRQG